MGQQQSNEVEKGRRRNTALADGFITGTSGKVEEKYKIDVRKKSAYYDRSSFTEK